MNHRIEDKPGPVREAVGIAGLLGSFLFGGMAFGMTVAVVVGGGSPGAIAVAFLALPLAFGLPFQAWRTALMGWLLARLATSAIRSGGDEARFRASPGASLEGERGRTVPPGGWVFVPVCTVVGGVGAVAMALTAAGDPGLAGILVFGGSVAEGLILRRLAQRGLLPVPAE